MTPSSLPSRPACRCPLGASLCRLDSIYATCPEKAGILPFLVPRGSGGGIPRDWRAAARMERPTFFFHKMNRQRCGSQHSHFQQRLPQFQVDKLSFDLCSAINGADGVSQIRIVAMNVCVVDNPKRPCYCCCCRCCL